MCRLALFNKEGVNEIEKVKGGLLGYLEYLEKECGGHGNGIVLVKDGNISFVKKGIEYTNEMICDDLEKQNYDYFIYHTRVTSQGSTCDEQCHPFVSPTEDFALVMNGTENEYGKIGKLLGTSDTDALFRVYHSLGIHEDNLKDLTSRFIGYRKNKWHRKGYVFFTNPKYASFNTLHVLKVKDNNDALIVGSSFPLGYSDKNFKIEKVKAGYYWKEGEEVEIEKASKRGYVKYGNGEIIEYNAGRYVYDSQKVVKVCSGCGNYSENVKNSCWYCGGVINSKDITSVSVVEYNLLQDEGLIE